MIDTMPCLITHDKKRIDRVMVITPSGLAPSGIEQAT